MADRRIKNADTEYSLDEVGVFSLGQTGIHVQPGLYQVYISASSFCFCGVVGRK